MSKEDFETAMFYLDKIEEALNTIASLVGHPSIEEFTAT